MTDSKEIKEKKTDYFAKIPNNLFCKISKYDDKLIPTLTYLSLNKNFENICGTSIEHIVLNCKMKLNKNKEDKLVIQIN